MSCLTSTEQLGIKDLLEFYRDSDADTAALTFDLAKVVCKNLIIPQTFAEAVDLILLHSSSLSSLLSRKAITKGVLFKYLNARRVPVNVELNKIVLIEKTIGYWEDAFAAKNRPESPDEPDPAATLNHRNGAAHDVVADCTDSTNYSDSRDPPENFPIHRMSRLFTGWFFEQYNAGELSAEDFFCDAHCDVELLDAGSGSVQTETADGADGCAAVLLALRDRYAFYFNPNAMHAGCQGRLDPHGLVLVLSCGTLHVQQRFVGCWECAFGLVRDPFTDNNWKVKHMRLRLRSLAAATLGSVGDGGRAAGSELVPQLAECEMLQGMLALPASEMDLG